MDYTLWKYNHPDGHARNGAPYWIKRNGRRAYSWSEWAKDWRKLFNQKNLTFHLVLPLCSTPTVGNFNEL